MGCAATLKKKKIARRLLIGKDEIAEEPSVSSSSASLPSTAKQVLSRARKFLFSAWRVPAMALCRHEDACAVYAIKVIMQGCPWNSFALL